MSKVRRRPRRAWGGLAVLFALSITACQSAAPRMTADLQRLQGLWQGRGPGGEGSVTIAGNSLRFEARPDFWYETTIALHPDVDPKQLHATIDDESASHKPDVGRVVVAIFKFEGETLTLGVIDDYDDPPLGPVDGEWERAMDRFVFDRAAGPVDGR